MTFPRRRLEPVVQRVRAPGPRQRRAAGCYPPPGAHHRDRRATPLGHPARRRPMGPAHPQPASHHLPVQGPGLLLDGRRTNPPLQVRSCPEPLPEAASLAGLIGIPDDDPAVQLLINDAPARHKNVG